MVYTLVVFMYLRCCVDDASDKLFPSPLSVKIADLGNACWVVSLYCNDVHLLCSIDILLMTFRRGSTDVWRC